MSTLLDYFNRCWNAKYIHVENAGSYAIEREGDTLYLLFQKSNGLEDWKNNFDFPAEPYTDMEIPWKCHRGFLKVWKSIEPYIEEAVKDTSVKEIVVIGYSHGAAIAMLAHEYVWYHRPDLREKDIVGFGYGAPRCYWGWSIPKELKERWETFYIVRNNNDIVTYVPPVLFGFRHTGTIVPIGDGSCTLRKNKLKCIDDHRPENYIYSLENLEQ